MFDLYLFLSIIRDWWWVLVLVFCGILLIVAWFVEKAKNIANYMADKHKRKNFKERKDDETDIVDEN